MIDRLLNNPIAINPESIAKDNKSLDFIPNDVYYFNLEKENKYCPPIDPTTG